jgi:hypothetical protein
MKNLFFFGFLMCTFAQVAEAAIIQLNNNSDRPLGHLSTWTTAQNAAADGDTIMVHGSPTSYGSISLSKSLVIIGPGHKPNKVPSDRAIFGSITIGTNKTGVKIYGVFCTSSISFGSNTIDLLIEGVYATGGIFNSSIASGSSGIRIKNSVMGGMSFFSGTVGDLLIEHNYIYDVSTIFSGFGEIGNKLVNQNIIVGKGATNLIGTSSSMRTTVFTNNIFYGVRANVGTQIDCVYGNNLSFGHSTDNSLPPAGQSGSGNIVNQDPQFVNAQPVSADGLTTFYTRNFRLQPTSPAIGTGTFGTDMGMYTPTFEFSMTGEPLRPQVLNLTANPGLVPPGGSTTIEFTGRKATVVAPQ